MARGARACLIVAGVRYPSAAMSSRPILGGWAVVALAAAAGCYTGSTLDPNGGAPRAQASDGTLPAAGGLAGDLPCDVAQVLGDECQSCHGDPLAGDAPNRLLVRADLMAHPDSDPSRTMAEISIARMRDAKRPMPPSGVLPDGAIASLEKWVADGYPAGACGGAAGTGASAASVCTSGTHWTGGDRESPLMHPGGACIDCHMREDEGPSYSVAGTLFPTLHEPTDCNGTSAADIVIMDEAGKTVLTLTPNRAGNFFSKSAVPSPYRAKVVSTSGKVREMKTPQTDGDCNACHSEKGAQKATGRVRTP